MTVYKGNPQGLGFSQMAFYSETANSEHPKLINYMCRY